MRRKIGFDMNKYLDLTENIEIIKRNIRFEYDF